MINLCLLTLLTHLMNGTPPSDSGNSNFKSLSDLLEVESTTKTPSSSIDNQLVSRQLPNVESFGRDSNLGLKQLLPADSIIKGGIEKLGEALPPPINPDKPSKASCEAQGSIFNAATGSCQSTTPPPINPDKPSKASCEAQGSIFNAGTGLCESKPPLFDPSKPSKASCEAQGSIFNAATGSVNPQHLLQLIQINHLKQIAKPRFHIQCRNRTL